MTTMNKILYTFVFLFLGSLSALGQSEWFKEIKRIEELKNSPLYRHEVGIAIGGASAIGNSNYASFVERVENKYDLFTDGWFEHLGSSISVKYFCHLKRYLALGGSIGYIVCNEGYNREDWRIYDTDIKARSFYLMPTVKGQWVDNKGFGLYSKFGLGVGIQHMWMESDFYVDNAEEDWCVHPVLQVTFLGLDFGVRKFRINMEFGVGSEGGFSIGTTYYFERVRK